MNAINNDFTETIAHWYAQEHPTDPQLGDIYTFVTFNEAAAEIKATGCLISERYGSWLDSAVVEYIYQETKRRMDKLDAQIKKILEVA